MIEYQLTFGGSGRGISHFQKIVECPRKARLDRETFEQSPEIHMSGAADIGTLFHAFMDLYHNGDGVKLVTQDVVFVGPENITVTVDPEARLDAERLFRAYQDRFSATYLGKVSSVELQLSALIPGLPKGLTCRIDMDTVLNQSHCRRIEKTSGIKLAPGRYLVDHKTTRALMGNTVESYQNSHQATLYQLMYKHCFPQRKLKGMLFNVIVKTKQPRFILIPVEYPGRSAVESLKRFLTGAAKFEHDFVDWANSGACFFPYSCRHFESGACNRI